MRYDSSAKLSKQEKTSPKKLSEFVKIEGNKPKICQSINKEVIRVLSWPRERNVEDCAAMEISATTWVRDLILFVN